MGTNERENRYNTLLWDELKNTEDVILPRTTEVGREGIT